MVADVLEAIGGARSIERTIVVTGDPIAQEIAAEAGAEVVPDPGDAGHVAGGAGGNRAGRGRGRASASSCSPGDCPLLDPRELDRLLTGVPERYVAVVPDRHGTGTNALVLSPPSAIVPAFGEGSRERHVAAAREAGIPFGGRGAGLARTRPRHPRRRRRPDHAADDQPRPRQAHRQGPGDMSGHERADDPRR